MVRATGESTRIIDRAVQDFFTKGSAVISEILSVPETSRRSINSHTTFRFVKRLESEHRIDRSDLIINERHDKSFLVRGIKKLGATPFWDPE